MPLVPIIIIVFVLLLVVIAGIILFIKRDKIKNLFNSNKLQLGSVTLIDNNSSDCTETFNVLQNRYLKQSNVSNVSCANNFNLLTQGASADSLIVGNINTGGGDDINATPLNPYKNVIFYGDQKSAYALAQGIKPTDVQSGKIMLVGEGLKSKDIFESIGFKVEILKS